MSFYRELSLYKNICGVDVFFERFQTRTHVGMLEKSNDSFHFSYDPAYLKTKNSLQFGVEFPLTRQYFSSETLFPSFADRLPDPNNPAYEDHLYLSDISLNTSDPILLLTTIGKRGPSSFIFEPIYDDSFTINDYEKLREMLDLSMFDFAKIFDVSLSVLQKMKVGESSGKEVLKRLQLYTICPMTLYDQIQRNLKWLHQNKQRNIMFHLLKENLRILEEGKHTFKEAKSLIKSIFSCSAYTSVDDDKKIMREMKPLKTEYNPILKIAEYCELMDFPPHYITFCSKNEKLGYDGIFQWLDQEVRIEVTTALDKETGGRNKHFREKDADKHAIIPICYDYYNARIRHPNQINDNTRPLVSGKFEETIKTVKRLREAFNEKNDKRNQDNNAQYQGMWLIITLPLPFHENHFNEICISFWKSIDKNACVFSRVFVVSEVFVNCGDIFIGSHRVVKRNPFKSIWDSENLG